MAYQIKGLVEVYNGSDICDDDGHLATCENAEIAFALAAILNERGGPFDVTKEVHALLGHPHD